jgi:hypothetical protein
MTHLQIMLWLVLRHMERMFRRNLFLTGGLGRSRFCTCRHGGDSRNNPKRMSMDGMKLA